MNEELTEGIDRDLAGTHVSHLPPIDKLKQMTMEEKQELIEKLKYLSMNRMFVSCHKDMGVLFPEDRETTGTTKKLRPV